MSFEPSVTDLLTVAQAIDVIDSVPVIPRVVDVTMLDAIGRRLAIEVAADRDYPAFDKSQMDGFAVRCTDVPNTPTELPVIGEIAAGATPGILVPRGSCVAIMTGAPVPRETDGIIPVEHTERIGAGRVRILQRPTPGKFIAARGSDRRERDVILRPGDIVTAGAIAACASVGLNYGRVFARPLAAVIVTGDEIVANGIDPEPGQIRDSNGPMLTSLLRQLGCDITGHYRAADRPEDIAAAISAADRGGADAIFLTGGMSMGTHDHVPGALINAGFDLKVRKLRIKPGKPFAFGVRGPGNVAARATFAFGLPGNPVSAFVCTLRLASRMLDRIAGGLPRAVRSAPLAVELPANGPREFYLPARWEASKLAPLEWCGSADIFTLARADAMIIRPADAPAARAGDDIDYLEIPK